MSTTLAWCSVLCLLAHERVEVAVFSSSWFSNWEHAERLHKGLRLMAHALGWLALLAWGVSGNLGK